MSNNLPDIQKSKETRGVHIDEVGIKNYKLPTTVPFYDKSFTIANIDITVNLDQSKKGTHMSRFIEMLNCNSSMILLSSTFLEDICSVLDANEAYLNATFPVFLKKYSPVTNKESLMSYDCSLRSSYVKGVGLNTAIGVEVLAKSCCPCSKEISDYGAHNQRSIIKIDVHKLGNLSYNELIEIAESSASCEIYPLLKREDEKYVTEKAYADAKFVEDIVRDGSLYLDNYVNTGVIGWYYISSTNQESIHTHDAFARIERGERCIYLEPQIK